MVDKKMIGRGAVGVLVFILFIVAVFILKPILGAIFFGVFAAYILHPLYIPLKRKIPNGNASTIIFLLLVVLLLAIPLWFFLPSFAREVFDTYLYVQNTDLSGVISGALTNLFGSDLSGRIAVQVNIFIVKFFSFSLDASSSLLADLPSFILQFSVFLFTLYFSIKDSEKIKKYITELSPLSQSTENKFATEFRQITNSIVFGQIVVGIIQGLLLGLGLWVLGVKRVLFLTTIAIIISIIPVVGAWLVWIPVSFYLFISGNTVGATILFFYGLLFISTIDNVLRPYFISKRSHNLNIFVAIIGTLGGLYTFGVIGLILGPLVLSYLLIIIDFYKDGKLNEIFKD